MNDEIEQVLRDVTLKARLSNGSRSRRIEARELIQWSIMISSPQDPDEVVTVASLDIDDTLLIELIHNWTDYRSMIQRSLNTY